MLRKLKQWYLGFRINSAREDLQVAQLAMRDKVRMVHMYADKLEALLNQAGHVKRTHFDQINVGLARYEATGNQRTATKYNELITTPTPTPEKKD